MNIREPDPHRYPSALNKAFEALEELLEGRNYNVFIRHYHDPEATRESDLFRILRRAWPKPPVVLCRAEPATQERFLAEVSDGIKYRGDSGHGPFSGALEGPEFQLQYESAVSGCRLLSTNAMIEAFELQDGHPACPVPVFWGFAFAVRSSAGCHLIVGSASD